MSLPPQFADLEPFVDWSLPTENTRLEKRLTSTMDEIRAFYDAFLPRATEALTYLNDFALNDMPDCRATSVSPDLEFHRSCKRR